MKLKDFRKKMKKDLFKTAEAHLVAFQENPSVINLQLHQWQKSGDIIKLKRGLFMFATTSIGATGVPEAEIARALYEPCYFSLEYVLSKYGIIPEAVFTYTLVTPKATRRFNTPLGIFHYQTIKKEAFTGFDTKTLFAEKEKALADYFYLNSHRMQPSDAFWLESRIEVKETGVNFKKALAFAALFKSKKLLTLLNSLFNYAKSH